MSGATNTWEQVKAVILSVHEATSLEDQLNFYNTWAETYEQDVAVLEFRAPSMAVKSIDAHFRGDREGAVVLDVACGTGKVAKQLKDLGFGTFVGIDGSEGMLALARKTGVYQDLKLFVLGDGPLPVPCGTYDVVVIAGALCAGHVPVKVVRELCKAAKPGGYICMTTRSNPGNMEYKKSLDQELKTMEEEGIWNCVDVVNVEDWERAVSDLDEGYISGTVYVYKKV